MQTGIRQTNVDSSHCSAIKCLASREEYDSSIMPSALAFASNGKQSCPDRIAFDTMCQDSFISENIAKNLNLIGSRGLNWKYKGLVEKYLAFKPEGWSLASHLPQIEVRYMWSTH